MIRLDGKQTSATLKKEIAEEVEKMVANGQKRPHLAAILVGHDGASETYVGSKVKSCEQVGFTSTLLRYENTVSEEELLQKIEEINLNDDIDGLIVQLPLPAHISEEKVTEKIDPRKDVDGFHPQNMGRLALGSPCFVSATPHGIMELIARYNIETSGKKCVVIGRSNIVGRPMSILMSQKGIDTTVTLCHSRTQNLKEICLEADIIIAALGKAEFLKGDMVKEGATVIDVGITRVPSDKTKSGWKLLGDVDFAEVAPKCSHITPVPGGVGPMTIASLLFNTLKAAKKEVYSK
ncbi:MAG: bifunctional 5,10-methylenetetrahydrofolate dehydrogenase/5,10-methenyltetrahydrofolate cyclohydrolase [Prolixibacteraceae bacterium]|jgi:methylenetetrahydrofolate dehydrogenase (NADP+)/methenyltetrahydrofolate cyclohydrolase|nr:bifunctional 5,10-methylene-tetrahydrofolate dehydrogenase/5,10-methylene-tetrahydrofolate cyclohydrolase [Prolixibacteraceae bacterium]